MSAARSPVVANTQSLDAEVLTALLVEGIHQSAAESFLKIGMRVASIDHSLGEAELIAAINGNKPDLLATDGKPLGRVNILGIRSKTSISTAVINAIDKNLMAIGCFCIGTNQVDLVAANARGIPVFNAPYANTRSVAELVICEVIALSRKLGDQSSEVHKGIWKKSASGCFEVRGKTIGIVGYGHIGSQVGVLAEMLGMRVVYYDHVPKLPMGNNRQLPTLDAVFEEADFVTLHVPETPETKNMVGKAQLAKMKRGGSYLLNLSRGTVVVIDDLAEALQSGHLAGAAVDVYPEEPEANGTGFVTPLQGKKNVILTPHVGGSTVEAQKNIGVEVSYSLGKFVTAGSTTGVVNFPVVEPPSDIGKFHRLINIHQNVPGVLREINRIVSEMGGNVRRQMLSTDETIGYLIIDIDQNVSREVHDKLVLLPFTIQDRVVGENVRI